MVDKNEISNNNVGFAEMDHARTLNNSDLLVLNQKSEEQQWSSVTTTLEEVIEASISGDAGNVLALGNDSRLFLNVKDYVNINKIDVVETDPPTPTARATYLKVGPFTVPGFATGTGPMVSYLRDFPAILSPVTVFWMPLGATFTLPFAAANVEFGELTLIPPVQGDAYVTATLNQHDNKNGTITFTRNSASSGNNDKSIPASRTFTLLDSDSGVFRSYVINLCSLMSTFSISSSSVAANRITMTFRQHGGALYNTSADIFEYTVTGIMDSNGNVISKPLDFSVIEPAGFFREVIGTRSNSNYADPRCYVLINEPFVGQVSVLINGTHSGKSTTGIFTVNVE